MSQNADYGGHRDGCTCYWCYVRNADSGARHHDSVGHPEDWTSEQHRSFEKAALALATLICPQEAHCDRCRNKASEQLSEMLFTLSHNGSSGTV